ncbi:MAG TPA: MdtA/MuxA family multidrug efflux RND transporter periplasmic adaptor subunit [Terriglobales bacterium]|nr:MdtA/MuxA family multidrug efflux RND transporter periplasmic adaptor subunit [Terriglobales bacterium]
MQTKDLLFGLVLLASGSLLGCGSAVQNSSAQQRGKGAQQQQAVSVGVALVEQRDVPVYLTGLGSVTAFNTVAIKSRVDGQLVRVAFREGQEVRQGELLAVLDQRPFQVALEQARATLFRDQAQLKNAQLDLERFKGLVNAGIVSRQQVDTQTALVGQLEGAVHADQAAVDNAKLNLVYTRIVAPISGRVGLRMVDVGNMVHASDPTPMLILTQLQPISAVFTLPEDQLPSVAQHMRNTPLRVEAYSRDDRTKLATGTLLTIDNQIDQTTGTGKLKAIFTNEERALWPNQFVNVHLLLEVRKNSIVIPSAGVQRGPDGMFTYVVKPDKTVEVRPVSVALTEGGLAAVAQGLRPGEMVVTDGQDKLQAGSKVEPRTGNTGHLNASSAPPTRISAP